MRRRQHRMSVFPGKGVDFVIAALKSPPVRNRNMAVKTLAEWNRENWPVGIAGELQSALAREPDSEVAETMERVLKGQPFEVTEG